MGTYLSLLAPWPTFPFLGRPQRILESFPAWKFLAQTQWTLMYFPISAQQCRECLPWVLLLEITLSGSYKAVHWPSQTTYNENEERSRVLSLISKKYSQHFFLICEAFHDYY